jgi:hypothetical protein
MFKHLALAFVCAALVNSPSPAETLNGEVSMDRGLSGSGDVQIKEGTPAADADQGMNHLPPTTIIINHANGRTTKVDIEKLMTILRERGLGSRFSGFRDEEASMGRTNSSFLQGSANQQLSALGICWTYPSSAVEMVDPACDLAGKLVPGDRILAVNGLPPMEGHRTGSNFGNAGEVAQVTFSHEGVVQTLPCKRQPIANFSQLAQSMLNFGSWRAHMPIAPTEPTNTLETVPVGESRL